MSVAAGSLLAAVSVYSVDAIAAMRSATSPGFLAFAAAIAVPAAVAWLLDRRLVQQLGDIRLRSHLWLDLVDAVRHGCVDVPNLGVVVGPEGEVMRYLRQEAAQAARFLASRKTLIPHLPILGHCFTLQDNQ
jgi:hypothetical protein